MKRNPSFVITPSGLKLAAKLRVADCGPFAESDAASALLIRAITKTTLPARASLKVLPLFWELRPAVSVAVICGCVCTTHSRPTLDSGQPLADTSRYETAHFLTGRSHWDRRRIYRDGGRKSHSKFGGEQALGRVCGEARFRR